jgi:hypothetical protein
MKMGGKIFGIFMWISMRYILVGGLEHLDYFSIYIGNVI